MSTVAQQIPTLEQLENLITAASDLEHQGRVFGINVLVPSIHAVPRELFRQLDAPERCYTSDRDNTFWAKHYRGITLYCDQPELDIPKFVVLEYVERGPEPVQPSACHHPMSIRCVHCDYDGRQGA